MTAFNGTNRTYLLYVVPEISSPLVIPGKLKGKNVLDFVVPLVPTLPGQPNATLTYFEVTRVASRRRRARQEEEDQLPREPEQVPVRRVPVEDRVQVTRTARR